MTEQGEESPQSDKEKTLSPKELEAAENELRNEFEVKFENSLIKEEGVEQMWGGDFTGFCDDTPAYNDQILIYKTYNKENLWWRVDQSQKNKLEIFRGKDLERVKKVIDKKILNRDPSSGGYEKFKVVNEIIALEKNPSSISYKLIKIDHLKPYSGLGEEEVIKEDKNTAFAIRKAKELIADIPQVKK